MSNIILHGVLNMPTELWSNSEIDKMQRHGRYIEASVLIKDQKEIIDELAAALKDTCSTILDKDACSKICEECHVYIALQKVK